MPVDKSQQRIRRMFGAIAPRYDLMNRLMTFGLDRGWRRRIVGSVAIRPEARVLDVCCGTGDLTEAWASKLPDAKVVIGADFTWPMLDRATTKARKGRRRGANISYVGADTLRLPVPSDQFDVVSVGFGIRNVGDTARGLREMSRVCCPGGHVIVLETSVPGWPVVASLFRFYFHQVVPRLGRWLSPDADSAYTYLPASTSEFPQGESFAELMREAGLEEIVVRPLTMGSVTLYVGRKPS